MNLRHIEIFHAVYVNGSVSAAARALNVSQPSVSKMLRHAEILLGFQLFQRTSGGLVPTEDAHSLFADVSEIQDRVHALREAGRNLRARLGGTLRISALPSLALDALPTAVARFMRTHENVKFDLQTVHHDDLLRKLTSARPTSRSPIRCRRRRRSATAGSAKASWCCSIARRTCPTRRPASSCTGSAERSFISLAASGPIGGGSSPRNCSGWTSSLTRRGGLGPHLLHRWRAGAAGRRHGRGRQLHRPGLARRRVCRCAR